jgi:hypothetical protein
MAASRFVGAGIVLAGVFMASCKENVVDSSTKTTELSVGQQCSGAGDAGCGTGAVCVLGVCRLGCTTDAACPQGALCIGDGPPYGCQLATEMACSSSQPCSSGLTCGLDRTCRISCSATKECPRNEQTCIHDTCVGKGELHADAWFSCTPGAMKCTGPRLEGCDLLSPGWAELETCESADLCQTAAAGSGTCSSGVCKAGAALCDGVVMKVCNAGRTGYDETPCATAALCASGLAGKACTTPACEAGETTCDSATMQVCSTDRTKFEPAETCASAALCDAGLAAGACVEPACKAGEATCGAFDEAGSGFPMSTCKADLTGVDAAQCYSAAACTAGLAQGACAEAELVWDGTGLPGGFTDLSERAVDGSDEWVVAFTKNFNTTTASLVRGSKSSGKVVATRECTQPTSNRVAPVVDATHVYWFGCANSLVRTEKATNATVDVDVPGLNREQALQDDAGVYVTVQTDPDFLIQRLDKATLALATVTKTGPGPAVALRGLDATWLYYSDDMIGALYRVHPVASSVAEQILAPGNQLDGPSVAFEDTLYWSAGGKLVSKPLVGGSPSVVLNNLPGTLTSMVVMGGAIQCVMTSDTVQVGRLDLANKKLVPEVAGQVARTWLVRPEGAYGWNVKGVAVGAPDFGDRRFVFAP